MSSLIHRTFSITQSLLALFLYMPTEYPKDKKPKMHKPVEAIAILYVLIHFIAPFISAFMK